MAYKTELNHHWRQLGFEVEDVQSFTKMNLLTNSFCLLLGFTFFVVEVKLAAATNECAQPGPQVELSQGILEGCGNQSSRGGRKFQKYLGIPFGKIEERFGMSKAAEGWKGVKRGVDSGEGCMASIFGMKVEGKEDCLTLDVYTPNKDPGNQTSVEHYPVMVWIYGGGFFIGSASQYDGSYFMDHDVVLVVLNYRLGPLGFLNAGVKNARGNQGLKDMVLGLHWVQDNIAKFGGDKDRVTIFGESAGSISVSLLTFSPMSEGLFHRAIMQSGTAVMHAFANQLNATLMTQRLGQKLGCPSNDIDYLVKCLQRVDPVLLTKSSECVGDYGFEEGMLHFTPSLETYSEGDNDTHVFYGTDIYDLLKEGKVHKVPMIIGMIASENGQTANMIATKPKLLKKLDYQWSRLAPKMLYMKETAEDPGLTVAKVREHFFDGNGRFWNSSNLADVEKKLGDMLDERHWIHPLRVLSQGLKNHTEVYLFNFTQRTLPKANMGIALDESGRRTPMHADDVPYFFKVSGFFEMMVRQIDVDHPDIELSKNLLTTWVNFAKEGKPGKLWGTHGGEWTSLEPKDDCRLSFLQIDHNPKMQEVSEAFEAQGLFWEQLPLKEYGKKWESEQ